VALRTRLVLLFTLAALLVGSAGTLLLARRLQLGLESDLDGVLRQRAASVAESSAAGRPDLTDAEGPVQLVDPTGRVVASAGGASGRTPLMNARQRHRAAGGVLLVDAVAPVGRHGREHLRVLGRPAADGRSLLVLAVDREPADDVVERTLLEVGVLGVPATALLVLGVWMVTGAALRPVERMRVQAAGATPGDPTVLTVPPGGDELTRLAVTLNDLLAAQQSALRAEQSFLADAGHELRTPLAILAGELELADRPARTTEELRSTVTVAREETTRLVRLAEHLLVLARVDGTGLQRAEVDLRELAQRALTAWTATARTHGVELVLQPGPRERAVVDADRVRQVLDNLLANALRVAPQGSVVEVAVTGQERAVEVSVRDHGPGFPAGFLPHAFERFRRADPSRTRGGPAVPGGPADGGGTGLGLAVVRRVAEAHGGTATAEDPPGGGALVRVVLPRAGA
jgi:two-component system, OmpR family, sensor kinase